MDFKQILDNVEMEDKASVNNVQKPFPDKVDNKSFNFKDFINDKQSVMLNQGKKKLLLKAPVLNHSGYSVHSRIIAAILNTMDEFEFSIKIVPWGQTPFIFREFEGRPDIEKAMNNYVQNVKAGLQKWDISVQVVLPNEWEDLAKYNIGISAFVETDVCKKEWIHDINRMNLVMVPSQFIYNTIQRTAEKHKILISTPIVVVPETYNAFCERETQPLDFGKTLETEFNFLSVMQFTANNSQDDRKNIYGMIKTFCDTFRSETNVGFILKANVVRNTKIDRISTYNNLKSIISSCRVGQYPRIYLLHGPMDDDEIASLYKHSTVKAFVSFTRGEGFGLPLIEAAACGLPVIATNWSGHLDFLNLDQNMKNFVRLDYELMKIPKTRVGDWFVEDSSWAEVNYYKATQKLMNFYKNPQNPTSDAKEYVKLLKGYFSFSKVRDIFVGYFKEYYKP